MRQAKLGAPNKGAISDFKAELKDSVCENASIGSLVNQTLKSVVREIRTPRSVGVGAVRTAPSTRRRRLHGLLLLDQNVLKLTSICHL